MRISHSSASSLFFFFGFYSAFLVHAFHVLIIGSVSVERIFPFLFRFHSSLCLLFPFVFLPLSLASFCFVFSFLSSFSHPWSSASHAAFLAFQVLLFSGNGVVRSPSCGVGIFRLVVLQVCLFSFSFFFRLIFLIFWSGMNLVFKLEQRK